MSRKHLNGCELAQNQKTGGVKRMALKHCAKWWNALAWPAQIQAVAVLPNAAK